MTVLLAWLLMVGFLLGVIFASLPIFDLIHAYTCDCGQGVFFKRGMRS